MQSSSSMLRVLFVALLLFGCSSTTSGSGGEGGQPTADEKASLDVTADAITAVQQSMNTADSVFRFDPDLAPAGTAQDNASKLKMRTTANLGGCGSASLDLQTATLTVDFGPPPGCKLTNGPQISGSLVATVARLPGLGTDASGGIKVTLTFKSIVINSVALSGSIAFTTKNGSTFDVTLTDLSSGTKTLNGSLTVVGAPGSATIDGMVTSTSGGKATSLAFAALVVQENACYANAGSVTLSVPVPSTLLTFDAKTPTTGYVTAKLGTKPSFPYRLPAYGSCPPDGGS